MDKGKGGGGILLICFLYELHKISLLGCRVVGKSQPKSSTITFYFSKYYWCCCYIQTGLSIFSSDFQNFLKYKLQLLTLCGEVFGRQWSSPYYLRASPWWPRGWWGCHYWFKFFCHFNGFGQNIYSLTFCGTRWRIGFIREMAEYWWQRRWSSRLCRRQGLVGDVSGTQRFPLHRRIPAWVTRCI